MACKRTWASRGYSSCDWRTYSGRDNIKKIFFYRLHSKDPREVLYAFKLFLYEVGGKVARIILTEDQNTASPKKIQQKEEVIQVLAVNASQNHHTVLFRVDRAVRTLKGMITNYYAEYRSADWEEVIFTLVRTYNNTIHESLYLKDYKGRKYSYTPEQYRRTQS